MTDRKSASLSTSSEQDNCRKTSQIYDEWTPHQFQTLCFCVITIEGKVGLYTSPLYIALTSKLLGDKLIPDHQVIELPGYTVEDIKTFITYAYAKFTNSEKMLSEIKTSDSFLRLCVSYKVTGIEDFIILKASISVTEENCRFMENAYRTYPSLQKHTTFVDKLVKYLDSLIPFNGPDEKTLVMFKSVDTDLILKMVILNKCFNKDGVPLKANGCPQYGPGSKGGPGAYKKRKLRKLSQINGGTDGDMADSVNGIDDDCVETNIESETLSELQKP